MRTAKLVEMIKEIGNNNNMVLRLNERSVNGGPTAADTIRAQIKAEAVGTPPAVVTPQRQQPGPAGGSALNRFNASVAANRAATGVSPKSVVPAAAGLGRGAKVLSAAGAAYSGYTAPFKLTAYRYIGKKGIKNSAEEGIVGNISSLLTFSQVL